MTDAYCRTLRTACAAAACVALGTFVAARFLRPHAPPNVASAPATSAEAALSRVLPEIDLEALPFDEAVGRVRRLAGAPIAVDWRALSAGGVDTKRPVTFRARNATVELTLDNLCRSASIPGCFLGLDVTDDGIVLSARDTLSPRSIYLRTYDVRDLIAAAAEDPWEVFGHPRTYHEPWPLFPLAEAPEELVFLIQSTVAPDSWRENGGDLGSARYFAGRLVVVQTRENHWQIARLLAQLRQPDPEPLDGEPPDGPDFQEWDEQLGRYVSVRSNEAESALRRRLAEVRLDRVPLEQALSTLAAQAHANLHPDWLALKAVGITRRFPVSADLRDVTLAEALRALFNAPGDERRFCFAPSGAYVRLAIIEDECWPEENRTYNVRDCVTAVIGPAPADPAGRAAWQRSKEKALELLARFIENTVAPGSWRNEPGLLGTISETAGRLQVNQTWENQEKVAALLAALRADPAALRRALITEPGPKTAPAPPASPPVAGQNGRGK